MFGKRENLVEQYNPNEGMEWNYQGPPRLTLADILGVGLHNIFSKRENNVSLDRAPQKPLSLWGLDMPVSDMPIGEAVLPTRANYEMIRQYNPAIADDYSYGVLPNHNQKLTMAEIQQLINNGNIQ